MCKAEKYGFAPLINFAPKKQILHPNYDLIKPHVSLSDRTASEIIGNQKRKKIQT